MTEAIWYTRCPVPTAMTIALHLGTLEREFAPDGVSIRSLAESPDRQTRLSHYRHSLPASIRFGGYVPPLVALSRGADLKIVGIGQVSRLAGIFALPNGRAATGADLRGKRLSLPRRQNDGIDWWRAEVLCGYRSALALAGLTLNDVELVDINIDREYVEDANSGGGILSLWGARSQFGLQREEIHALIRGEIDAIFSESAVAALLKTFLDLRLVVDLGAGEDGRSRDPMLLTASGELARYRPDLVARWISQLLRASAWAASNRQQTQDLIAKETGLPSELVDLAYPADVSQRLNVTLDADSQAALAEKARFLHEGGFVAGRLDIERALDPIPLSRAIELDAKAIA